MASSLVNCNKEPVSACPSAATRVRVSTDGRATRRRPARTPGVVPYARLMPSVLFQPVPFSFAVQVSLHTPLLMHASWRADPPPCDGCPLRRVHCGKPASVHRRRRGCCCCCCCCDSSGDARLIHRDYNPNADRGRCRREPVIQPPV